MADVDVDQWLEGWVENNLSQLGTGQIATAAAGQADRCVADAAAAGIASNELTKAAGGGLATYLADRQAAMTRPT